MAKKRGGEEGGGDSWLNTYADMVTLLLTFFAVLLSMSNTDEAKFNAFIKSFSSLPQSVIDEITSNASTGEDPGIVAVTNIQALYDALTEYVQQNNQSDFVQISKVDDIIYIRFSSMLLFEPDKYILRKDSLPTLDFIGNALKKYEDIIKMVNVIGHTATVQDGTYWMLSGERAAVVATHFNFKCGFNPQKLTVVGYGNQYPIAPNDTEENMKENRRVELIIIGSDSMVEFDISDILSQFYDSSAYPTSGSPSEVLFPPETSPATSGTSTAPPPPPADAGTTTGGGGDAAPPPKNVEIAVSPYAQ